MINSYKNVLITGGAGRIGFAIAKKLINSNYCCLIADNNENNLEEAYINLEKINPKKIKKIVCDVTSSSDIDKLILEAEELFGTFHGAIHCAYPKSEKWGLGFEELTESELKDSLFMQLGSSILFSQKIIESYRKFGGGDLIHLSSIQGIQAPKFEHYEGTDMESPIEYSAIKSGIIAITKWLAKKYKNMNIRVNCISPGGILDNQPEIFLDRYRKSCTNIGMLNPYQVADAAYFLLSDSSKAINGQNIIIDDGWSL
tara:strand:+ start:19588 stop:20358 length:771 start_codon:yes stop_codon:yes gene_type:complete